MRAAMAGAGWRVPGIATMLVVGLLLLLYRDTTQHVVDTWNTWTEAYSHGYLALAISLYMVYRQREQLARLVQCASPSALPAVALSCLLWLAGALSDVLLLQYLALPLLIVSVVWAMLGAGVAKQLVLPLLVIIFALPVWEPLTPLLQDLTVYATFEIVRMLGVPVFHQGHVIVLPVGWFAVKETCSGIAYLLAAVTLGLLYAYLNHRTWRTRVVVVATAAVAAVVANILRVVIVVYRGYETSMQTSLVNNHFYLGWYLFGGLALILVLVDHYLYRDAAPAAAGAGGAAAHEMAGNAGTCGILRQGLVYATVLVLLVAAPAADRQIQHQTAANRDAARVFPAGAGGWTGPMATRDAWHPVYHGAVGGERIYSKAGRSLYLYVGYYPVQQQGSELIYYLNRISDEKLWKLVRGPDRRTVSGGPDIIEQAMRTEGGRRRLVWYWYHVAGRDTTNKYVAKGLQAWGMLTGIPQSAVFAIATDYEDDAGQARLILADFIRGMAPALAGITEIRNATR